jgi:SH3 domain protein
VKKIYLSFFIFVIAFGSACADILYIADDTNLTLRGAANSYGPLIKVLSTGTSVTVVGEPKNGFIKVRLIDGTEGFIRTKYTKKEPPEQDPKDTSSKNLVLLQNEISTLKGQLEIAQKASTPDTPLEKTLATERDQLSRELGELKITAKNAKQIEKDRDELREKVVEKSRYSEQLERENKILKDTTQYDWLLYGGALVIIGIILGFILPKISWRSRSGWDSY